jgi:flagellar biosynthesis/type III secretory pathway protein FliH
MKYDILLKKSDGTYNVSCFECKAEDSSRQLALYLFSHYPVSFFDDRLEEQGDTEKVLKDTRNGHIVWRQGDLECKLKEGYFSVKEKKEEPEIRWWEEALPKSKKLIIEVDIQNSYKKGFREGYSKGMEEGKEEGYRQGVLDSARHAQLN